METRELNPSDKPCALSEIQRQSRKEINGGIPSDDKLKPSDNSNSSISSNGKDTADDKADNSSNNGKPKQELQTQGLAIEDLVKYRGLTTLQELAKTAREAKARSISVNDASNVRLLTDNSQSNFLKRSEKLLDNAKITNDNRNKVVEIYDGTETFSAIGKQLSYGAFTRGTRKTLEAAITDSLADHVPKTNSRAVENSFSTLSSFTTVSSNASLSINSNPEDSLSRSSPMLSPLSTACQCSPTAPSLSSPQLPSSLFDMSNNSFFSNDNSSHTGDDNEDQRSRSHSSPGRWSIYEKTIENHLDDDDDENEMVNFITNAMGSSACATVEYERLDKDKSNSEWVIDTNTPVEMPELKTPHTTPVAVTRTRSNSPGGLLCLLITGEKDDARLKNSIQDALHTASIQIATPAESVTICTKETFDLIWVRVTVPVREELLSVITSVRCATGKSKGARIIAIADKTLLVDLLLRLFDDVFLEPLPVMTIRHKYSCLSRNKRSSVVHEMDRELRDLNTPESSLSLESVKSSQSTPSDSRMDFSDLALQSMKHGSHNTAQTSSTGHAFNKSSLDLDSPLSPAWCKVEHANKEKQRRVRIKDSCDQLRKLLPYVRGRKTDMASILEMTVDYLQIVNTSLPVEFQTRVIEMLSPDLPLLERKLKSTETVTPPTKPKDTLMDTAPLGKPLFIGGKAGQICSSTSIITKPGLNKNNLNNCTKNFKGSGNINLNNSNTSSSSNINNINRMITRSQVSNSFSDSSPFARGNLPSKTEPNMFTESIEADGTRSDSNANTLDGARKLDHLTAMMSKSFHKREMPLNTNLTCSNPKRPHVVLTAKTKDTQAQVGYQHSESAEPSKKPESALENAHRLSGIQFPHMFTEGDISANRMFSTGHVSRSDVFPYQAPSYLNPVGPPRLPGVPCEGGEMVASVNNMFFDTAYYYYPSSHDANNGNYFVNNGGSSEYVNPNAVMPMTSNSTSRITNFNLGRRYERLSVSGDSERYSETAIGSVSLHHHQHQQH